MKNQNILALALKPARRVRPGQGPTATLLVTGLDTGLESAKGSTVGPDGALYVTEGAAGRISRVDPQTGEKTTFASGLPPAIISIGGAIIGGAIDVAFIDNIAHALVTLVSPYVSGRHVDGIYRGDGPDSFTCVAAVCAF